MCLLLKHTSYQIQFDLVPIPNWTSFPLFKESETEKCALCELVITKQFLCCRKCNPVVLSFLGLSLGIHSLPFSAQLWADICTSPVFLGQVTCIWFCQVDKPTQRKAHGISSHICFILFQCHDSDRRCILPDLHLLFKGLFLKMSSNSWSP